MGGLVVYDKRFRMWGEGDSQEGRGIRSMNGEERTNVEITVVTTYFSKIRNNEKQP